MKIIIHRGTNQIGGCITEIQAGNDRIIIDLGSNLQGTPGQEFSPQEIYDIPHKGRSQVTANQSETFW